MEEIIIDRLEWQAPEYAHKEREIDFFWTIGLVSLVGVIATLWMHDYLFAVFIIISCFCLILFTSRPPQDIEFSIDTQGITLGKDTYSWRNIRGFDVKSGDPYMKLIIETDKRFLPTYTIPLPRELTDEVRMSLIKIIPNIEIEESQTMLFVEKIGF